MADAAGNVWIGRRKEVATMAHAAKRTFVTFEELRAGDMLEDELLAPGVLAAVYVEAVAPPNAAPGRSASRICMHRRRASRALRARREDA